MRVAFVQVLPPKCRKCVMLLGDMRQRLYSEPFDLEDRGFDVTDRVFHLDTVYRSTARDRRILAKPSWRDCGTREP